MGQSPIKTVTQYPSGSPITSLPAPTVFEYNLRDISAPGAGRNQAYTMTKKRVGQEVDINLKWNNIGTIDGAAVLNAFNSEYVTVEYMDAKEGDFVSKLFYVGDRQALCSQLEGFWSEISFSLIQRNIDRV